MKLFILNGCWPVSRLRHVATGSLHAFHRLQWRVNFVGLALITILKVFWVILVKLVVWILTQMERYRHLWVRKVTVRAMKAFMRNF